MKALSIKPQWAHLILIDEKDVEYRTWQTKYRGDLLICSSQAPKKKGTIAGHALCVVNLYDITYDELEDIYEWHITDVRPIKPFPVKGKLNIYNIDDSLIEYLPNEDLPDEEAQEIYEKFFEPLLT